MYPRFVVVASVYTTSCSIMNMLLIILQIHFQQEHGIATCIIALFLSEIEKYNVLGKRIKRAQYFNISPLIPYLRHHQQQTNEWESPAFMIVSRPKDINVARAALFIYPNNYRYFVLLFFFLFLTLLFML